MAVNRLCAFWQNLYIFYRKLFDFCMTTPTKTGNLSRRGSITMCFALFIFVASADFVLVLGQDRNSAFMIGDIDQRVAD